VPAEVDGAHRTRWVRVGTVSRAHGVRGELRINLPAGQADSTLLDVDAAALGAPVRDAQVMHEHHAATGEPGGTLEVRRIEHARVVEGGVLLRLEGVTDRTAAEALRGASVWVDRAAMPEPEDHEYYVADLVGLEVIDARRGRVGVVRDVVTASAQDLLAIAAPGGELLVPLVAALVPSVDIEHRVVRVDLPDGLEPQPPDRR
jgi:16S rRNA processing protein RimM